MINVWEELVLEPQIWPGSNRSLQQVTWHKNHVMAYKMSSWHSLLRSKMTIKCKRSFVEMTLDKPYYASFGPFYLVDCLNIPAHLCPPPPPPLKSWEGHVSPPSADPRWHVINSEMSDIDRVTCALPPLPKLWEGHVLPSPFPFLIHSEMPDSGRAICAPPPPPPPFSKVRRGTCPLLSPILAGRDAWHKPVRPFNTFD